jgi:hypothetical protein
LRADYASDLLENRFIAKNVAPDATPDIRITLSDIYQYVSSLQDAVDTWFKMYNPFDSDFSIIPRYGSTSSIALEWSHFSLHRSHFVPLTYGE